MTAAQYSLSLEPATTHTRPRRLRWKARLAVVRASTLTAAALTAMASPWVILYKLLANSQSG